MKTDAPSSTTVKQSSETVASLNPPQSGQTDRLNVKRLWWFGLFTLALTLAFIQPLIALVGYSLKAALHSHAVLIPLISGYLIWLRRGEPLPAASSSFALAVVPLAFGLAALKQMWFGQDGASLPINDRLALSTFSYVCLLWAGALMFLGGKILKPHRFPLLFLIFLVPLPTVLEHAIEVFFQYTSADASALLFNLTGSTVFREGQVFRLPGISIEVAEECSGIRSSLVLFITSLLAGHMFLKSPWRRIALSAFVIPLAILRNGLRVYTIAMLCVHVDPSMIDSPIHRRGGPFFFLLSLIPFFALLLWLRHSERKAQLRQANKDACEPRANSERPAR